MYYKRITPNDNLDWLKEIDRRIANLETPPSGSMYIRDGTITTVDPVTGGQTQFGTLPDGSRGFKPFIYDITPPPVATSPIAVAEPGVFIISWDGFFVGGAIQPPDFECCNIIGHKIVGGATVSSVPVGLTRRPLDITFVQTDVAAENETWQFSLEAEDYNGNRAAWSGRSAIVTMVPISSVVDLSAIEADIAQAQADANTAQAAAAQAQTDADTAASNALAALNTANGAIRTYYTPDAPTGLNNTTDVGDLWFDSDNGQASRWTGTEWVLIQDNAIAVALAAAQGAQNTADLKADTYRQDDPPVTGSVGDLWFDTNDKNKPYYCTSIAPLTWTAIQDGAIIDASNLAASKGKVIIQSSAPAVEDRLPQNLWIDTTGGANTPKRWDTGSAQWVVVTDKVATDAAAAVIVAQTKADQAFNNAATAATAAGQAQTTADGKNRVWYQATAPAGTSHKQNDIWFETDNDHRLSKWNATTNAWEVSLIGNNAILANLDAGKITVGYILAAVLKAKSITTDKLVITSTDNLAVEADFGNNGSSWQLAAVTKTINATAGRGSLPAMRFTGTVSNQTSFNLVNKISVGTEDRFRGSIWVKSSDVLTADTVQLKLRCYTSATVFSDIVVATNAVSPATKNVITPVNTYVNVAGISPVLPIGTIAIEIFLSVTLPTTGAIVDIDYVGFTRASDGNLVVDGTVTAAKLESELVLASKIIAGDITGTHAEMSPQGFRVYAADPSDGIPNEVVRLGVASTDDYFAVTKADGSLAASISQDGVGSFAEVYANTNLYYKGEDLSVLLARLPRGPLYKAELSADIDNITTEYGLMEAEYTADGTDRQIELSCGLRVYPSVTNTEIYLKVRYTTDGSAPTITSTLLFDVSLGEGGINTYNHKQFKHTIRPITGISGYAAGVRIRFLMTVTKGNGDQVRIRQGLSSYFYLEDIGAGIAHSPSFAPGGGSNPAPPPPVPSTQTYVKQYGCWNSMNYQGNNNQYNFDTGRMYQGLSPAGYGNLKSIGLFDRAAIQADLSGASINYVRVYFNFAHWYYNSGGTARIGIHNHTGIPGTFSSVGPLSIISSGWPKPGARWLELPGSHWEGWKNGYGGVYLEGDSSYTTYGYADRPTLEISYNK